MMSDNIKSTRNSQLDKDLLKFLVRAVQRKPLSSTLDSLLKYSARLDDKVFNYMGSTKGDLKNFINMFSSDLYVDETDRVCLVNQDGQPQSGELINAEKMEKSDRPQPDKPISHAVGSIYRILGKYGFIQLHPPHEGKVYFDGRHVEDGRHMFLIDYGYKEGMKVQIDAIPGPENAEASYRAKHVCRLDSDSSNDGTSFKSDKVNIMVDKVGKIAQVFDQYGFISRTASKIDDVFFFMNTIAMPNGKHITKPLHEILSPGMEAKFDARPNHRLDAQNSWYATRVWIPGLSDQDDGSDKRRENGRSSIDGATNDEVYISDEDDESDSRQDEFPSLICGQKGSLKPIDDSKGLILFGKNYKYEAKYISEVVLVEGKKVDDQAWRFEGGHEVNFNARVIDVRNEYGNTEKKIIATLVWIGAEPTNFEVPTKDLYLLYAERHKLLLILDNIFKNVSQSTAKPLENKEVDLLDEFIAGNYPRNFDNEPLNNFPVPNMQNSFMPYKGLDDHWGLYNTKNNELSNHLLQPLSSSPPYSRVHPSESYPESSSWSMFGLSLDEEKCWKNPNLVDGTESLNLVNSLPKSNVYDSSDSNIMYSQHPRLNGKSPSISSTNDIPNTKNACSQTDSAPYIRNTASSSCQTDVSSMEGFDPHEAESLRPTNSIWFDKKVVHCPKCHHVLK